ncbi:hypothetical protein M0804_009014 [Polistes exclamans]|nr:hypothetical protein M0804_009014 [Polistes exclamans]
MNIKNLLIAATALPRKCSFRQCYFLECSWDHFGKRNAPVRIGASESSPGHTWALANLNLSVRELEIVKCEWELARTVQQSDVSMQEEPAIRSSSARISEKTIAELLSFFDGKAEDFPGWKKQVIALQKTYRLNDDKARILIGMRFCGKALEWMHSRLEFLETNLNDLMERFESMFYHKPNITLAFWSIPLKVKDKARTAFDTQQGYFQWTCLPFGLRHKLFSKE